MSAREQILKGYEKLKLKSVIVLLETAQIKKRAVGKDARGGTTETFTNEAYLVPCRVSRLGPADEKRFAASVIKDAEVKVEFPFDTEIAATDRFTVAEQNFTVTGIAPALSTDAFLIVFAREI